MASFRVGDVRQVVTADDALIEVVVEVDGEDERAVGFPRLCGPVEAGDRVVLNTTAVDLALGTLTGHFIVWNLDRRELAGDSGGHIMKLRYTGLQHNVLSVEEPDSPHHKLFQRVRSLDGMPVVIGGLHSHLAPAAAVAAYRGCERVVYVMTDGAALPVALSKSVRELKARELLSATVTYGNAFGGDYEAVNVYTALLTACHVCDADLAIVCTGPGVTGTGTLLGTTALEQGPIVDAVNSLGGGPVVIPRLSFADPRPRHRGISQHTLAALSLAAQTRAVVAMPQLPEELAAQVQAQIDQGGIKEQHDVVWVDASITEEALSYHGLEPTTMGRDYREDVHLFRAAGAAVLRALDGIGAVHEGRRLPDD